jgi:hypothetical protein
MKAVLIELPAFARHRSEFLDDDEFMGLQNSLMENPEAGDLIQGAGGLRKVRYADPRRGKGKRSGLRVIYFWWLAGNQFWLYTLYDKDTVDDLTAKERATLKEMLKLELNARRKP